MFTSKEQGTLGLQLVEGQLVMSCNTQDNPSTEGYLAENVRGAEAEKPCVRRISSCAISLTKSFKLFFLLQSIAIEVFSISPSFLISQM